jgi:hypothetical protein
MQDSFWDATFKWSIYLFKLGFWFPTKKGTKNEYLNNVVSILSQFDENLFLVENESHDPPNTRMWYTPQQIRYTNTEYTTSQKTWQENK